MLNLNGDAAIGSDYGGQGALSINGATPAALVGISGGQPRWLSASVIAYIDDTNNRLATYDVNTHVVAPLDGRPGQNRLGAAGGKYVAFTVGVGVVSNISGLSLPAGTIGDVDEFGTAVVVTDYNAGKGIRLYAAAGTLLFADDTITFGNNNWPQIRTGVAAYNAGAVWVLRSTVGALPYLTRPAVNRLVPVVLADGTIAVTENTETLTYRVATSGQGYVLGPNLWNHDAREISPGVVRIQAATNVSSTPSSLVLIDLTVATGANRIGTVQGGAIVWATGTPFPLVDLATGVATTQKYFGYYYASGRYGDFFPRQNCTVLYVDNFSIDNVIPDDAPARMRTAAQAAGGIFTGGDQANLDVMKNDWGLVKGILLGEISTSAAITAAAQDARVRIAANGLAAKPIGVTLTSDQMFLPGWTMPAVDFLAVEIYLTAPGPGGYAPSYAAAMTLITDVLAAAGSVPVYLIAQAFDRSGTYMNTDSIAGIIDACKDALVAHP